MKWGVLWNISQNEYNSEIFGCTEKFIKEAMSEDITLVTNLQYLQN